MWSLVRYLEIVHVLCGPSAPGRDKEVKDLNQANLSNIENFQLLNLTLEKAICDTEAPLEESCLKINRYSSSAWG
jgi:hypothetical protein